MADDVTLPGTGAVVATDEVAARHYQLFKPAFGADGSATLVAADQGLPVSAGWTTVSGSASANNTDVISIDVAAYRFVAIQITGTFSATISWQVSNDNTNWQSTFLPWTGTSSLAASSATTSTGVYAGPLHARYLRARITSYTSGTVSALAFLSTQPSSAHAAPVQINNASVTVIGSNSAPADAQSNGVSTLSALSFPVLYNGSTWDRARTPSVFKTASTQATGSTALWTPTSSKKFRLMRFRIDVTADAAMSSGGVLTIDLLDSATTMGITHSVYVPATAGTTMGPGWSTGWADLGNGRLSSAANNVLNVSLSSALTSGAVRVVACGTED